jgi:membrane associated rhomboid family serine protease
MGGFNLTPMVRNLLFINIGVFLIMVITKVNLNAIFGLRYFESPNFHFYQIVTHMFMHADSGHLFSNMFGLFMFGPMLEKVWGQNRFLLFYMVCGLGAAFLYSCINYYEIHQLILQANKLILSSNPEQHAYGERMLDYIHHLMDIPMVGASGAIFGVLLAFGMLFPNTEMLLLFFPIPIKAKYFVILYGLYELYAGIQKTPGDNVAHFAHIGGMIFAFILIKYWQKQKNSFY